MMLNNIEDFIISLDSFTSETILLSKHILYIPKSFTLENFLSILPHFQHLNACVMFDKEYDIEQMVKFIKNFPNHFAWMPSELYSIQELENIFSKLDVFRLLVPHPRINQETLEWLVVNNELTEAHHLSSVDQMKFILKLLKKDDNWFFNENVSPQKITEVLKDNFSFECSIFITPCYNKEQVGAVTKNIESPKKLLLFFNKDISNFIDSLIHLKPGTHLIVDSRFSEQNLRAIVEHIPAGVIFQPKLSDNLQTLKNVIQYLNPGVIFYPKDKTVTEFRELLEFYAQVMKNNSCSEKLIENKPQESKSTEILMQQNKENKPSIINTNSQNKPAVVAIQQNTVVKKSNSKKIKNHENTTSTENKNPLKRTLDSFFKPINPSSKKVALTKNNTI